MVKMFVLILLSFNLPPGTPVLILSWTEGDLVEFVVYIWGMYCVLLWPNYDEKLLLDILSCHETDQDQRTRNKRSR